MSRFTVLEYVTSFQNLLYYRTGEKYALLIKRLYCGNVFEQYPVRWYSKKHYNGTGCIRQWNSDVYSISRASLCFFFLHRKKKETEGQVYVLFCKGVLVRIKTSTAACTEILSCQKMATPMRSSASPVCMCIPKFYGNRRTLPHCCLCNEFAAALHDDDEELLFPCRSRGALTLCTAAAALASWASSPRPSTTVADMSLGTHSLLLLPLSIFNFPGLWISIHHDSQASGSMLKATDVIASCHSFYVKILYAWYFVSLA